MFWQSRLACSFCRRSEAVVSKLVAGPRRLIIGPRVFICDQCVAVSAKIMEQPVAPPVKTEVGGWWKFFSRSQVTGP